MGRLISSDIQKKFFRQRIFIRPPWSVIESSSSAVFVIWVNGRLGLRKSWFWIFPHLLFPGWTPQVRHLVGFINIQRLYLKMALPYLFDGGRWILVKRLQLWRRA